MGIYECSFCRMEHGRFHKAVCIRGRYHAAIGPNPANRATPGSAVCPGNITAREKIHVYKSSAISVDIKGKKERAPAAPVEMKGSLWPALINTADFIVSSVTAGRVAWR